MAIDPCHVSVITGICLLWAGVLTQVALHAYVMTFGDLYAMFRRARARCGRPFRLVVRQYRGRPRQRRGTSIAPLLILDGASAPRSDFSEEH